MKSEEDESDLTKSNGGNHGDGIALIFMHFDWVS